MIALVVGSTTGSTTEVGEVVAVVVGLTESSSCVLLVVSIPYLARPSVICSGVNP
jgi:hypothetical protein